MAIIPYEANKSIQPFEPQQQSAELYTAGGRAFGEAAKELSDISSKFLEIRNTSQKSKASTDFQIELNGIEGQAANDPNVDKGSDAYRQKIDEATNKHLQTITDPFSREEIKDSFRLKAYNSYTTIENDFKKRSVENAQFNLAKNIDEAKKAYVGTADPTKKQLFMDGAFAAVDANLKAGIISGESAKSMYAGIKKEWAISEAMFDAETNPTMAIQKLNAGEYVNLDTPEQRKTVRDFAFAMAIKLDKANKIATEERKRLAENEIYNDVLTGNATVEGIRSRIGVDIDAKEAEHYIDMLTKEVRTVTDPIAYGQYLDAAFNAKTQGELDALKNSVANDERISNVKALEIIKAMSGSSVETAGDNLFLKWATFSPGWWLIKHLLPKKNAPEAFDSLMLKVSPDDTPDQILKKAHTAINQTAIKYNPNLQKLTNTPQRFWDGTTTAKVSIDDNGEIRVEDDNGSDENIPIE